MVKISVVAPVYGVEDYIHPFLESMKSQTFKDFELILVDDGSKDNCPSILDEFVEQDDRYCVIHKQNGGVSSARNVGLQNANGEYIYFVDSDDWLEPNALQSLWEVAEHTHADVIYGATFSENNSGSMLKYPFSQPFFTRSKKSINEIQCALNNNNLINAKCKDFNRINRLGGAPWRAILKRRIIDEHNISFNEELKSLGEDILFWQNVYEYVRSVAYTDKPIYHYRNIGDSLSRGYKKDWLSIYQQSFREQIRFLNSNKKGKEHWEAFYFRVLIYIKQSMSSYYLNCQNTKGLSLLYKEFKSMVQSKPYSTAIKTVNLNKLVQKKNRIMVLLLRLRLYRLYWLLYKYKG